MLTLLVEVEDVGMRHTVALNIILLDRYTYFGQALCMPACQDLNSHEYSVSSARVHHVSGKLI